MSQENPHSESRDRPCTRKDAHALLDLILDLRDSIVDDTAGKDYAARLATAHSLTLARETIGWALFHQIGISLNGPTSSEVNANPNDEIRPPSSFSCPERDDDAHERTGRDLLQNWNYYEPQEVRGCIISLMKYIPGVMGSRNVGLVYAVMQALEALNIGDVHEIFIPRRKSPHPNPYLIYLTKLTAIDTVYSLRGLGLTSDKAEERMADIFGQSVETIRSWRKRDLPPSYSRGSISARWKMILIQCSKIPQTERAIWMDSQIAKAEKAANVYRASIHGDEDRLLEACAAYLRCTEPPNMHPE